MPKSSTGLSLGDLSDLYVRNRSSMVALSQKKVLSREVAEEIVHDAFLYLLTSGTELRTSLDALKFLKWKIQLLSIDYLRSTGSRPELGLEAKQLDQLHYYSSHPEPSDSLVRAENSAIVSLALAKLSDRHKQVLLLSVLENLPASQVAEKMSLSENATRQLLHRAKGAFRSELEGIAKAKGMQIGDIVGLPAGRKAILTTVALAGVVAMGTLGSAGVWFENPSAQFMAQVEMAEDYTDLRNPSRQPSQWQASQSNQDELPSLPGVPNVSSDASQNQAPAESFAPDLGNLLYEPSDPVSAQKGESIQSGESQVSAIEATYRSDHIDLALASQALPNSSRTGNIEFSMVEVTEEGQIFYAHVEGFNIQLHVSKPEGAVRELTDLRAWITSANNSFLLLPKTFGLSESEDSSGADTLFVAASDFRIVELTRELTEEDVSGLALSQMVLRFSLSSTEEGESFSSSDLRWEKRL